ncbi:SEL1-like repeat protein [Bartonella sp. HY761]|uniref:SEL1-like repeat protein n=1 Tax=Bartonella sp. HY761 TaxID=2979330 RepID=UPI0021E28331|nr:SEL1-like repeat protein [Bartonella sp. HY761]UXN07983.1 SEL1-like repeat protein [Bartonella sp. HY761]
MIGAVLIALCASPAFTYFSYPDNYLLCLKADIGEKDGQYQLGKACKFGDEINQDYVLAAHWYELASFLAASPLPIKISMPRSNEMVDA